jgi:hypothetical protein
VARIAGAIPKEKKPHPELSAQAGNPKLTGTARAHATPWPSSSLRSNSAASRTRGVFRVLRPYSPYHSVRDGVPYPAVVFTAGELDPRIEAHHAKKMTAPLQAAT